MSFAFLVIPCTVVAFLDVTPHYYTIHIYSCVNRFNLPFCVHTNYISTQHTSITLSQPLVYVYPLALYPGSVGGEKQPGIDYLCMCGHRHYISVEL